MALPRYFVIKSFRKFPTNILPSYDDILKNILFNLKHEKIGLKQSISETVNNVIEAWRSMEFKTIHRTNVYRKVKGIYNNYKDLLKSVNKKDINGVQEKKRSQFCNQRKRILNIRSSDETKKIHHQTHLTTKKNTRQNSVRIQRILTYSTKKSSRSHTNQTTPEIKEPTPSSSSSQSTIRSQNSFERESPVKIKLNISSDVASSLDRNFITAGQASRVLTTIAEVNDIGVAQCSESTVRRRIKNSRTESVIDKFNTLENAPELLEIHFDGKNFPVKNANIVSTEGHKEEYIAVVGSFGDFEEILKARKIPEGKAKNISETVFDCIEKYKIADNTVALCYDTTNVNSGLKTGAAIRLERMLEKDVLFLPCRHHIYEVIFSGVFQCLEEKTRSPEVGEFSILRDNWMKLNHTNFKTVKSISRFNSIEFDFSDFYEFCSKSIASPQIRDDYLEFMELSLIFAGGIPEKGISFKTPGPLSRARFMQKAIYVLKLTLFKEQFHFSKNMRIVLEDISIFIIMVYLKRWINSTNIIKAAFDDFSIFADLEKFSMINSTMSSKAQQKIVNQLWYLGNQLSIIAIFDSRVTRDEKLRMIKNMKDVEADKDNTIKKKAVYMNQSRLSDFVNKSSMDLFKILKLEHSFLDLDPRFWEDDLGYQICYSQVKSLCPVNDAAERAIGLISRVKSSQTKYISDQEVEKIVFNISKDLKKAK